MTLRAEHVCYAYGTAPVLADCSLTLRPGELVFLLGVNGAGKSTLLKLLAGVLDVQQGAVYCGDEGAASYVSRASVHGVPLIFRSLRRQWT